MSETERRLAELNEGYVRSAQNADVEWYREHLADDFLISTVDGSLSDKAEFLRRIARGAFGSSFAAVDTRIRILGETALIHSGFSYTKPDGAAGRGRYTDIWMLRAGRWLCVSAHFNRFQMDTLEELNAGYIRSVATSDVQWFDRHLAEDFVNSNADGSLSDRAAFLAAIARPLPLKDFACEDVRIRVFGEVAIIHGRTTYRKPDGDPGAGRYTDVWARRGGRWVCVCADVTRT